MKSDCIGAGTLAAEILNVSPHGFWVLVRDKEYFLDYHHFPWFRRGSLDQLFRVELLHEQHPVLARTGGGPGSRPNRTPGQLSISGCKRAHEAGMTINAGLKAIPARSTTK
jgi:hypothetical protein